MRHTFFVCHPIRIVLAAALFGAIGLALVNVVAKEGLCTLIAVRSSRLSVSISPCHSGMAYVVTRGETNEEELVNIRVRA